MNKLYNIFIHLLAVCGVLGFVFLIQRLEVPEWLLVKSGKEFGISGIAIVEQQKNNLSFLVVHDNKGDKHLPRFALVKIGEQNRVQYIPLNFVNTVDLPTDFEALTIVPGQEELSFMALTSYGKVYHIKLDLAQQRVVFLGAFELPNKDPNNNFEGFALQKIDDVLLAAWADRGSEEKPGVMHWGRLSLRDYDITVQGSTSFRVPVPVENIRHISDLKIDEAGVVYISASRDSGNNGPFDSAVYVLGGFCINKQEIYFKTNKTFVMLYRLRQHKVEALELVAGVSGGLILATDDENKGSFVWQSNYLKN